MGGEFKSRVSQLFLLRVLFLVKFNKENMAALFITLPSYKSFLMIKTLDWRIWIASPRMNELRILKFSHFSNDNSKRQASISFHGNIK